MPGMDGLAVLSEARAQGITTPALFLTAKAEIEDRVTGLDASADDYLPKPFDASEFLARPHPKKQRVHPEPPDARKYRFGLRHLSAADPIRRNAAEQQGISAHGAVSAKSTAGIFLRTSDREDLRT